MINNIGIGVKKVSYQYSYINESYNHVEPRDIGKGGP
jgi:hypothetical protein